MDSSGFSLLTLLIAILYAVFTLLPNSHSGMVAWPGVALWQVTLICPVVWLILQIWQKRQILRLGAVFDWLSALFVASLLLNVSFAEFPNQARWQAWAAFCGLAGLYALFNWLKTYQRYYQLVLVQAILSSLFIISSLIFWINQIALPELTQLQALQALGIPEKADFSAIPLRNWYPLGHQNYVAGYLILALPLLLGLGLAAKGLIRWVCIVSFGLGLIDLYTTSSRGGALSVCVCVCVLTTCWLLKSKRSRQLYYPRQVIWVLAGFLLGLVFLLTTNTRLIALASAIFKGQGGGELSYRLITNVIGWRMGASHPLTGIGLGGVPLTYQKYHPYWAGQEAELVFQLHSTPAQLWGELGILGILLPISVLVCLLYYGWRWAQTLSNSRDSITQSFPPVLVCSLLSGLFTYYVFSLTDYQLDNIGISGLLMVYVALILFEFHQKGLLNNSSLGFNRTQTYQLVCLSVSGLIAVIVWLSPIHFAWKLSSEGFYQLDQGDIATFAEKLEAAHRRVPWEPYYVYQLGWNFGNLTYQESRVERQKYFRDSGIRWLQAAHEISPYQEFGYSNLGWLLVNHNAEAATQAFAASAKLAPAKKGIFFGLGYSLLNQGEIDLALNAWLLEILRQPILLTSPIWQSPQLQPLYPRLLDDFECYLTGAIVETDTVLELSSLQSYWRRIRGSLYWWQGDLQKAAQDWLSINNVVVKTLLTLEQQSPSILPEQLYDLEEVPAKWIFLAWQQPEQRKTHLVRAWLSYVRKNLSTAVEEVPQDLINDFYTTMGEADTFDHWIKQKAPSRFLRNERTGFNSLSRHVDGPNPEDFLPRQENIPITHFLGDLWSSKKYNPELEKVLQPMRNQLMTKLLQNATSSSRRKLG